MYSPSDNIEVITSIGTDKITEDLFDSFLQRYQKSLEELMRGREFVFDNVDSLYYKLHKISLNRGGSYIVSPKWLKNKKATINPKNNDDKCFQYALTVALIHERIKSCPEGISNIKPFTEHARKIIDHEKKEMIPLTKKEEKMHNKQKVCYICKKRFSTNDGNKKCHKVRDHCHYTRKYRGAAHDICNLRYKIQKEIPIAFHNGSTYDYHFIIKELAKQFEREFEYLGENTEK